MALALRACAAALKRHGIEVSIPFRELMGFRNYWIEQGMSYSWQARRSYIQQLFEPAIDVLFRLDDARLEAVTATSCSPPSPLQPLLCGERTRPGPKDPARRAVVPLGHYVTQHPGKSVTPRAGEFRDAIILRKKGSGIKPGTVHSSSAQLSTKDGPTGSAETPQARCAGPRPSREPAGAALGET